jgi:magnesium-transporting ATPase (P-type)
MLGALLLMAQGSIAVVQAVWFSIVDQIPLKDSIVDVLTAVDAILLGTVLLVIGYGLYELFVDTNIKVPAWLQVRDLDDLKSKLGDEVFGALVETPNCLGVLETGVVMAVLTLLSLDLFLPGGLIEPVELWLGSGPHSLELARTAAFTVLVLTQLFNCFNARSATASAFSALFSNPWLWAAVGLSAALQVAVVHLPWLNLAFGTVPMSAGQWGVCVLLASGVLWVSEARKLLRRR